MTNKSYEDIIYHNDGMIWIKYYEYESWIEYYWSEVTYWGC